MLKYRRDKTHFSQIFKDEETSCDVWVVGEVNANPPEIEQECEVIIDVVLIRQKNSLDWLDCTQDVCDSDEYSQNLVQKIIEFHDEGLLNFTDPLSVC